MKKFAVFDIDGTVFRWQLFHEIVFELFAKGHLPAEAKKVVDEQMENWRNRSHKTAFRDYEMALLKAFLPMLPGLKKHSIEDASESIMGRAGNQVYAYTRDLIKTLKAKDYTLIALSGSPSEIIERFGKQWGFDIALGQGFDHAEGTYTGKLADSETLLIHQKDVLIKQLVKERNLSWNESIAVGDSLNDAKMLAIVEHPIAFNPDEELFEEAKKHGWKVVVERKNMIFELELKDGSYLLAKAGSR